MYKKRNASLLSESWTDSTGIPCRSVPQGGFFFFLRGIHSANHHENRKSNNDKADNRIDEGTIVNRNGSGRFGISKRRIGSGGRPFFQHDEKICESTFPNSRPIGGMTTSATSDLMIRPKATPITIPTAISTTLPPHSKVFEFL